MLGTGFPSQAWPPSGAPEPFLPVPPPGFPDWPPVGVVRTAPAPALEAGAATRTGGCARSWARPGRHPRPARPSELTTPRSTPKRFPGIWGGLSERLASPCVSDTARGSRYLSPRELRASKCR